MRPYVLFPPVLLLLSALVASLIDFDSFLAYSTQANNWILSRFDWLFLLSSFVAVLLLVAISVSPLGAVRIGGHGAAPLLKPWSWFSITLCTTIATGILFWGAAEPIFHINDPPAFSGVTPRSDGTAQFALSSMYMHWTVTPYAIYSVGALAFALAHYNLGAPYSLSGPISAVSPGAIPDRLRDVIDAVGLFALVAGVAASLGAGAMALSGGMQRLFQTPDTPLVRLFIVLAIVAVFVVSSISGIQRGIRILSSLNIRIFFAMAIFVFVFGPTGDVIRLGGASLAQYVVEFIPRSLNLSASDTDGWTRDWTVFYYANWFAWAPVTALFLGRIARGYTVRMFLLMNLVLPALFGGVWMAIFGGSAIMIDQSTGAAITAAVDQNGPEAAIYAVFDALPFANIAAAVFVLAIFISFVTAMDSNTYSMSEICTDDDPDQSPEMLRTERNVKIMWGVLIGAIAWVMTSTTGIDGVRMLSNLGGLPGLFILITMIATLIAIWRRLGATKNTSAAVNQ
ncbi:MAG: BCCT family transporter [Pseudomonadota bacterium]